MNNWPPIHTPYKEKVTMLNVEPAEMVAIYTMAQRADALDLADIKAMDTTAQMALCLLIQHKHQLLVKSYRKAGNKPFTWTASRALVLGIHHLLTHSEILEKWEATMLLQLIDKYK